MISKLEGLFAERRYEWHWPCRDPEMADREYRLPLHIMSFRADHHLGSAKFKWQLCTETNLQTLRLKFND